MVLPLCKATSMIALHKLLALLAALHTQVYSNIFTAIDLA
jgi:hypothetical protein